MPGRSDDWQLVTVNRLRDLERDPIGVEARGVAHDQQHLARVAQPLHEATAERLPLARIPHRRRLVVAIDEGELNLLVLVPRLMPCSAPVVLECAQIDLLEQVRMQDDVDPLAHLAIAPDGVAVRVIAHAGPNHCQRRPDDRDVRARLERRGIGVGEWEQRPFAPFQMQRNRRAIG